MTQINDILNKVRKALPGDEKILKYGITLSGEKRKTKPRQYLTINTIKRNLLVKYAFKENSDIFQREYDALARIDVNEFVTPRPIKIINQGIVMTLVNGEPIEKMVSRSGLNENLKLLIDAITMISTFHEKYRNNLDWNKIATLYGELTGENMTISHEALIKHTNIGFTHGDLDPFNTFFDKEKKQFSLIDWEDFRENGIQVLDVIHFVVMLGVVVNPSDSHSELYRKIFEKYEGNVYISLLQVYCKESLISFSEILKFIPIYCDTQNYRLLKAGRDTKSFLYNDFKKIYYEK